MKKVHEIVQELSDELGIKEKIRTEIRNYKEKLGIVFINKRLIRINRKLLEDEKKLREVIRHELLHIKLDTKWHTPEFFEDY